MAKTTRKSQVNLKRKNPTTKSNTFEFGVFNLAIPEHIQEPQDLKKIFTDYIPFGNDNLFPQYLAELKRKSSTHRSVLAQKVVFTSGAKFVCKEDKIREYIKDVNADGESLRDIFKIEDLTPENSPSRNSELSTDIEDGDIKINNNAYDDIENK